MLPDWPRALGGVDVDGILKQSPEDFSVEECFEVDFSHDGEFDWLWVQKRGDSTEYVAKRLATIAGVPAKAVTYSGLKDRQAVTQQWFCIHLPGKQGRDWSGVAEQGDEGGWQVLRFGRHRQKLRIGSHRANRFELRLRDIRGDTAGIEKRLEQLLGGFPNYFGEQRFGRAGDNVDACRRWLAGELRPGRFQRGIYLSSARAYLFNTVLARRIAQGNWQQPLDGELFSLRDSGSVFAAEVDDEIRQRMQAGDIHPSGPLYGSEGRHRVDADVAELESQVFAAEPELCDGLRRHGMKMERRSLRVVPGDLIWEWEEPQMLRLLFTLPRGCFATALVRELINA